MYFHQHALYFNASPPGANPRSFDPRTWVAQQSEISGKKNVIYELRDFLGHRVV